MSVKVFLEAYQNVEMLQLNLECLRSMSHMSESDVIIIDMGFDVGIKSWLEIQTEYSYICAEQLENYAKILNTAISEFSTNENILILNANYICMGNCIGQLEEICDSNIQIGAAFPTNFASVYLQKLNLLEALDMIKGKAVDNKVYISLKMSCQCIFLTRRFVNEIGKMDEKLLLPDTVMVDYSFRGLCKKWKLVSVEDAYIYEFIPHADRYTAFLGESVDRNYLKEKWGMNYFNSIPNDNLVNAIDRQRDEEFTVLEIGCDCGANLAEVKKFFPKAKLFGLEINPNAAKIAAGLGEVLVGNIEDYNLPYTEQFFDYILFGDVLEHLRDPEQVVGYCKRFLRPQGKIIASIPNLMHYTVLRELIGGNFTYQDMGLLDRTHIHFFTYNEIIRMFSRAGYHIESCTYTMLPNMSDVDKQFVAELKKIGHGETFFYLAFQYLVVAGIDA